MAAKILAADDDTGIRELLRVLLTYRGRDHGMERQARALGV